jgi:putative transposase
MGNRIPFEIGEWYHCYSRGVDKRNVFNKKADYQRFIQGLYLSNSTEPIHRSDLNQHSHEEIFQIPRKDTLVAIGAYALMPNHFHLLLKEKSENGIARFMQKLGTAYTMYFNIRNERVGNLFVKPFRSKHVEDDRYFKYVAQYIHLNPIELFAPKWKTGAVTNLESVEKQLKEYPYSSFQDYSSISRPETILDPESIELLSDDLPPLKKVLSEAREYYREIGEA